MRVHYLQHVHFEDIGSMSMYFEEKNFDVTHTRVYENTDFPNLNEFDLLIIMGGPMGVYQESQFPWLAEEKTFIRTAIEANKIVLGFCLGAQLIAQVCGATVTKNFTKEIGWFNVEPVKQCKDGLLNAHFSKSALAFHWHSDTFSLPQGAQHLAQTNACENQAFSINDRVFGFQFHLETTPKGAHDLIKHCANELTESEYVQSIDQLKGTMEQYLQINDLLNKILDTIIEKQ